MKVENETQHIPVVTIVTVVYNAEKTIAKTIRSVVSQTYPNIEYIVIDGNSSDNTLTIVNEYKDSIRLVISEPDKGIYDAMNKALQCATGEWTCFMNSGDCFHDNQVLAKIFSQHSFAPNVGTVYGDTYLYNGDVYLSKYKNSPFWKSKFPYRKGMGISHQSMFVRTQLAKQVKFDLRYKISADFDMFYKIYKKHYQFEYVPVVVANYDINGLSSQIGWREIYREAAQIMNCKYNLFYNLFYTYCLFKEKCLKK